MSPWLLNWIDNTVLNCPFPRKWVNDSRIWKVSVGVGRRGQQSIALTILTNFYCCPVKETKWIAEIKKKKNIPEKAWMHAIYSKIERTSFCQQHQETSFIFIISANIFRSRNGVKVHHQTSLLSNQCIDLILTASNPKLELIIVQFNKSSEWIITVEHGPW